MSLGKIIFKVWHFIAVSLTRWQLIIELTVHAQAGKQLGINCGCIVAL